MHFHVTSIFLYACESWTLTAELQRRIQDMEMRCYRKILHISYKDHVTKEEVRAKIQQAIGPHASKSDKSISLTSKIRLMRSLVTSIFLYACESRTLPAELRRRIQPTEMRCYTSHTKTMLPTRKSVPRSSRQLDHTKTS